MQGMLRAGERVGESCNRRGNLPSSVVWYDIEERRGEG